MQFVKFLLLFLVINFGGLYLGNILMNNGPQTDWYLTLDKAPWTPPGWVFGTAWTFIMITFSIWCAKAFKELNKNKLLVAFVLSLILNISWNYVFFNLHLSILGLLVIVGLLISILNFAVNFRLKNKPLQFLLAPYIIWLCIATSLNLYIVLYN